MSAPRNFSEARDRRDRTIGKSFPDPTPPKETSAAQTGTSVSTAVANAFLQNPSENTPWGSTSVTPTGNYGWTDPYTNQTYNIPTFTRNTTLTPSGQATKDQTDAAQLNLGKLANQQSSFLLDYMGQPFDPNTNYSWDSSQATPESRRWVEYTPDQIKAMSTQTGGGGSGFTAGAFNPSKTYEQWAADFSANQHGGTRGGNGAAPLYPDRPLYDAFVADERSKFDTSERARYTDWQMNGGGGGAGGASAYSGPGGYWDVMPGSSGKWIGTPKTGSDRLVDWASLGNDDYEESRKRVEEALFSRLEPRIARDRDALETRLANQGIGLGSDLYKQGVDEFARQSTDARMQTILAGGQEQSRLFGMDQARVATNNAVRGQQIQEALVRRNQPLNEIMALLSGSQINLPQFMGANMPTIPTTDNAGIVGNYDNMQMQKAQMENQATGQILGGLFGLGGKLIGSKFWA